MTGTRYFLTVDWCNQGRRGIFCDFRGNPFGSTQPHTNEQMAEILGPFWLVLDPKSEPFTEETLRVYHKFTPLAEYSDQFGIARKGKSND